VPLHQAWDGYHQQGALALDANRRFVGMPERGPGKGPLLRQCLHTAAALPAVVVDYSAREITLVTPAEWRGLSIRTG